MSVGYERHKASMNALYELAQEALKRDYAALYREYETRLNGGNADESQHARRVLLAFIDNPDGEPFARLRNRELQKVTWPARGRTRVKWPVPMRLTWRELLILTSCEHADGTDYERPNEIFWSKEKLCIGFEVDAFDYLAFRAEQRKDDEHGTAN